MEVWWRSSHSLEGGVFVRCLSSMVLQWRWCGRKWPHVYRCSHRLNTLEGENDMKVIDLGLSPETWPSAVEVFHFFGSCLMFPHPVLSPSVVKSADWARPKDSAAYKSSHLWQRQVRRRLREPSCCLKVPTVASIILMWNKFRTIRILLRAECW